MNPNRFGGQVHISVLIKEFVESLLNPEQTDASRTRIEDVIDLLGDGRSFEKHHQYVKKTISDLFFEFDMCEECKSLYHNVVMCKLLLEDKPAEYFGALQANVELVRQFNAEREAYFSSRNNQSDQSPQS